MSDPTPTVSPSIEPASSTPPVSGPPIPATPNGEREALLLEMAERYRREASYHHGLLSAIKALLDGGPFILILGDEETSLITSLTREDAMEVLAATLKKAMDEGEKEEGDSAQGQDHD